MCGIFDNFLTYFSEDFCGRRCSFVKKRGSVINSNRRVKMSWISQNWVKVLRIFHNLWLRLSLSQKSRVVNLTPCTPLKEPLKKDEKEIKEKILYASLFHKQSEKLAKKWIWLMKSPAKSLAEYVFETLPKNREI